VIVKFLGLPGQPFEDGDTVIVAVAVVLVRLTAGNEGIFPVPPADRPMEVLSLVQLKPVPITELVKFIVFVASALHKF
jgi:hypothetical protein